ncbi:twin-arginine translocation pathway signal protein [Aquincola sp. S2]|uniref:Twin-arginine translocation pathway signal protein n=1 Tax=Pseudaquabacterium terrae TaxID=2732868 RepID=A0ABX2ELW7_9BURK|nr:twin-arginine translocation pathway signal protein [Aquabacterium terrae]NRF69562.1 twin-arginine translocation pathway signal protein [Aquabacterium terrae]
MQRRGFIRLVGGGVLGSTLAGCSTALPDEALAAWAGPGDEPDVRRWALAHALLAPNSHNRQPWLVDLREPNAISLHVDRQRLLPETDPWFRQIVVSQGTFVELLLIALRERGLAPQLQLFPQGEFAPRTLDDRPVARVHWETSASAPAKDPLFAQILRRHTAKRPFDTTRPVNPAHVAALLDALPADAPAGLRCGHTLQAQPLERLRALCLAAARVEVGTPRTALESARLMRIGPDEIRRHRDGISINGLVPRAATALGLFDRSEAPVPGSRTFEQVVNTFAEHSRTAMGFVWLTTEAAPGHTRSAEVWAGRAFVRQQLAATALGLQMHPMSQAPQEFPEMKPHYDALHRLLIGRDDGSITVQMLSRIGYCDAVAPAPRRPLDSLIRQA